MRFSQSFYLDLLSFLKDKFEGFYWGEDDSGYYWGDKDSDSNEEYLHLNKFSSLQDLVESIFEYIHLEGRKLNYTYFVFFFSFLQCF